MKDRLLQEEELDEGIMSSIADFQGVSKARSMMAELKSLGAKLDFISVYMIVGIQPFGTSGVIVKAGHVLRMLDWVATANEVHQHYAHAPLTWSFLGLSSFREHVEEKSREYIQHGRPGHTKVWIGDPHDTKGIIRELTQTTKGEDIPYGYASIGGEETISDVQKAYMASKQDKERLLRAAIKGGGASAALKYVFTGKSESVLRRGSPGSLRRTIARADSARPVMEASKEAKVLGIIAAATAAKLASSAWRALRTIYQAASGMEFFTIFPIISISPLSVTREGRVVHHGKNALITGPLHEVTDWLKVADTVHQKVHEGQELSWKLLGITTFREDANTILSHPGSFIHNAVARWVDDPRDYSAISDFITGDLPPEELYPELRKQIIPRRVRRGEDEISFLASGGKKNVKQRSTGVAGVYGYNPDLP